MIIRIRSGNATLPELSKYIEERLHFNLGRFEAKINSVTVSLSDGRAAKECGVRVRLGSFFITGSHVAPQFQTAADRAIKRVERALSRILEQETVY